MYCNHISLTIAIRYSHGEIVAPCSLVVQRRGNKELTCIRIYAEECSIGSTQCIAQIITVGIERRQRFTNLVADWRILWNSKRSRRRKVDEVRRDVD